jgi:AraC family transcriptional regulator
VPSRAIYFWFDPVKFVDLDAIELQNALAPRLFFEDVALWQTALKLGRLLDSSHGSIGLCFDALGVVLAHELVRSDTRSVRKSRARGGLAGWQRRTVAEFVDENLAEQIPLAKLANMAQLSPYHFCRAFKQAFGVPPHRYHTERRIERAKTLLADPKESVTHVGMLMGFKETSSFTAVFRKMTGITPTDYRRGLG